MTVTQKMLINFGCLEWEKDQAKLRRRWRQITCVGSSLSGQQLNDQARPKNILFFQRSLNEKLQQNDLCKGIHRVIADISICFRRHIRGTKSGRKNEKEERQESTNNFFSAH